MRTRTLFPEKFVSLKRNSVIRKQFMRERLNLSSQSNAYTKISCKSLWSDVNSPRKAWFMQPSQTVNMQWVQAVLRNGHPKRNTGSAKRGEPEDVISYVKYWLSRLHCPLQLFSYIYWNAFTSTRNQTYALAMSMCISWLCPFKLLIHFTNKCRTASESHLQNTQID